MREAATFPQIWPRRVYHPQIESRIVRNPAELYAMGSGWQNSPIEQEPEEAPIPMIPKRGRPRKDDR